MALFNIGIFIVTAKRTPFGSFGGLLKNKSCIELAEHAAKACILSSQLPPNLIDTVVFGNVLQTSRDSPYLARHTAIRAGVPIETPALNVNRLCGSGFQAVISAAQDLLTGSASVALAGGAECMSEAPFVVRNLRFGTQLGAKYQLDDLLWNTLTDHQSNVSMGITAENLAEQYSISREQCDEFALRSQTRWKQAHSDGVFVAELCPIPARDRAGRPVIMDKDEHPRENADLEQLAKLKPVFKPNGVVTAGNASGISDGAGALVLATEKAVSENALTPMARLVAYSVVGCDPTTMGIGPVPAVNRLMRLLQPDLSGRDVSSYFDLIEVNEAFASQYLAVEQVLQLNPEITNRHGGAIAMGHPVGASGARILTHLAHQLARYKGCRKRALGTACIGGGQGIAVCMESV
ncbi:Beta-ketoadipyl CoA thiolase [Fasciola hepatica]|uniref:Beta-ketoadipyl CoA thiolase n=1 Tax=Fasciola hepatica TaxID=6192 RepID=A0A4E0RAG8_FASHE|nr:Beta-ketoadipyl CoA thiolase [Fasciola hepatica]